MVSKRAWALTAVAWLALASAGGASDLAAAIAEAKRLVSAGMSQAALDRLTPLAVGPATARVTAELAAIRFQNRDFAGAADAYQRLAELAPDNAVVKRNLLIALYRCERFEAAEQVVNELGEATVGSDARALAVRGLLAAQRGDHQKALEDLEAAEALDTEDTFAIYELGLYHLAQGAPDQATAALREAVRRNPESSSAHYNLGQALVRAGDAAAGRAAFARATEISNRANAEQTRRSRGVALAVRAQERLAAGDAAAALRDLDSALEVFPDDPQLGQLRTQALAAQAPTP
ncbi:MAG: tetratricopeptide repeat protein [Acidobacteriota bacterium]